MPVRESGRDLFERHSNSTPYTDMTALEVVRRCKVMIEALTPYIPQEEMGVKGEGVVPVSACKALKEVVPIAEELQRHLPWIKAWSVGYTRESRMFGEIRSTFFGCQSKAQADRLVKAIRERLGESPRAKEWDAVEAPVQYNDMVKRTYTAEAAANVVAGLY